MMTKDIKELEKQYGDKDFSLLFYILGIFKFSRKLREKEND